MKIIDMRKPGERSQKHWAVDYDFVASAPRRSAFYVALAKLLQKPLRTMTSSTSVIHVTSEELARQIFDLAVAHGAKAASIGLTYTVQSYHNPDSEENVGKT